jgi:putative peptidoglycan lipid II flippase
VSNRYPGDEPGRTYQYPSWPEDGHEREREPDPSPWAADPAEPTGSVGEPGPPAYRPVDPDEPGPPYPPDQSYRPDRPQPSFRPAPGQHALGERDPGPHDPGPHDPGQRGPGPRDPAYPDGGFYEAPGNGYRDFPDDPPRRPVTNYRSPTTWSGPPTPPPAEPPRGRHEPDAPVEGGRDPGGWYQATPESPAPPRRPAEPPRPPEPVRPAEPTRADETANANQAPDERAWWDDAFQPSTVGPPAPPGRALPSGERATATPAAPPAPPRRPRPASAQGYGVPPGDLTQPISIYQPQPRFVPNPYQAEDTYLDVAVEETSLDLLHPIRPERPAGTSLARTTGSMALGTLLSRVTGFLRTFVFVLALGTASLANAYNNANTIPNAVYDVMIGGVLTSVVVPLLVKAAQDHRDRGEAYSQRMFTLTVLALGIVTIVATAAAGLLVDLYAGNITGREHQVMVVFAYFFIPQIFFYGLSSLMGAILNTRNSFAAPMWTPIINNVIVIVVGLLFVVMVGLDKTTGNVPTAGIVLLGVGTTLGIIVQTLALIPSLRRVGFQWRPRFDFRRAELSEIGRMAIWMFGYVISTQITFIVTTRLANSASLHDQTAGVSAYNYSYALFLLPYAIIGVSVTTALLPRMSKNAAEGRFQQVSNDFSYSIRLSSVILVPAALLLAVLGPALCELLFAHGSTTTAGARYIGEAFAAFSLGLLPFVIFQLLLRVFYAMHDSRTPAIIGFLTTVATVIGNLVVLVILPPGQVVIGMAFVYGLTSVFSAAIAWRLLNRQVGSLDGRLVTRSLVRMHVATIPAVIFALVVSVGVGSVLQAGPLYGLIVSLLGGGGALLLYVIVAKALHVQELNQLMRMVGGRFGRGPQGSPAR